MKNRSQKGIEKHMRKEGEKIGSRAVRAASLDASWVIESDFGLAAVGRRSPPPRRCRLCIFLYSSVAEWLTRLDARRLARRIEHAEREHGGRALHGKPHAKARYHAVYMSP